MREIKFRAWNIEEKKMYFNAQDAYDYIDGEQPDGDNFPASSFGGILDDEDWVVMQYTGIKDKNGKEIYEGDVVNLFSSTGNDWLVEWLESGAKFVFVSLEIENNDIQPLNVQNQEDYEVIGNIYENPELLRA